MLFRSVPAGAVQGLHYIGGFLFLHFEEGELLHHPSKTEEYLALAQRTANGLTRYWESWTDYLTTASRLYKYPFADQLMIYAQRPDATACADFDIWNTRMNRYVRRGAKGIALLDESSGFPRLHYVFDVSDTGVRRNSRDPEVWQLGPDLVQPVDRKSVV